MPHELLEIPIPTGGRQPDLDPDVRVLVGFSVAATLKKAGSSWYWRAPAAGAPGKFTSLAGTDRASVIVESGSANPARVSHEAAAATGGPRTAAISRNQQLFFTASLLCQNLYILPDY